MEDHGEVKKVIRKTFLELSKHARVANENLRLFLKDLPQPEMIMRIEQLNLSDRSLNFLCEGIALEAEDYEICMAVEVLKKQRAVKNTKLKEQTPLPPPPALPVTT